MIEVHLLGLYGNVFNESVLNYVNAYISIAVSGNNYLWLHKRSQNKSLMGFRIKEELHDKMNEMLDKDNLSYIQRRKRFHLTIDKNIIKKIRKHFC